MQVLKTGRWHPEIDTPYNSLLSIGILPAILDLVTGLDGVLVFKVAYPLIYSLVPVALYQLYRKILPPDSAFLGVFLLMATSSFYVELIGTARQEVAELFLVLVLCLLFSAKLAHRPPGRVITILLLIGIVTAHYSVIYIFLFFLACSLVVPRILRMTAPLLSASMLLITVAITLCWYVLVVSASPVLTLYGFVSFVVWGTTSEFFNPLSRPLVFLQAAGLASVLPGFLHDLNRVTFYLVNLSLVLGFFALLRKRQKTPAERAILPIAGAGFALVGSAVVLPWFATGLTLARTYHFSIIAISPCLAYGASSLQSLVERVWMFLDSKLFHAKLRVVFPKKRLFLTALMFSYFLFSSGWVWAVAMDRPTSLVLDSRRILEFPLISMKLSFLTYFTATQDIDAARWLSHYVGRDHEVCADYTARFNVLTSYAELSRPPGYSPRYYATFPDCAGTPGAYIYLGVMNRVFGIGTTYVYESSWSMSEVSAVIEAKNTIYSNGGAAIYISYFTHSTSE